MRILTRDSRYQQPGTTSPESIQSTLGHNPNLNGELTDFLLHYNGGSFLECILSDSPLGPLVISEYLPLSGARNSTISDAQFFFQHELGLFAIPFAMDPGGNYFLLERGTVIFWDHGSNTKTSLGLTFERLLNCLSADL